jgi:hypothetical protein
MRSVSDDGVDVSGICRLIPLERAVLILREEGITPEISSCQDDAIHTRNHLQRRDEYTMTSTPGGNFSYRAVCQLYFSFVDAVGRFQRPELRYFSNDGGIGRKPPQVDFSLKVVVWIWI